MTSITKLYDKTDAFFHTSKKGEESMRDYINRFYDAMNQASKARRNIPGLQDVSLLEECKD